MPIYEYKCTKCGERFEAFRSFGGKDEDIKCPACGATNPERIFSIFGTRSSGDSCDTTAPT